MTAISVGRECGIVPGDRNIYIPSAESEDGNVTWIEAEHHDMTLDAVTLKPRHPASSQKLALALTGEIFQHVLDNCSSDLLQKACLIP